METRKHRAGKRCREAAEELQELLAKMERAVRRAL
jgi:hypothetical protein